MWHLYVESCVYGEYVYESTWRRIPHRHMTPSCTMCVCSCVCVRVCVRESEVEEKREWSKAISSLNNNVTLLIYVWDMTHLSESRDPFMWVMWLSYIRDMPQQLFFRVCVTFIWVTTRRNYVAICFQRVSHIWMSHCMNEASSAILSCMCHTDQILPTRTRHVAIFFPHVSHIWMSHNINCDLFTISTMWKKTFATCLLLVVTHLYTWQVRKNSCRGMSRNMTHVTHMNESQHEWGINCDLFTTATMWLI